MKISRLEMIHLRLPLVTPFETSFGKTDSTETLILRAEANGVTGYGECPASARPGYSYETVHTAWHIIESFLAPLLKGVEIKSPAELPALFKPVRGHPMARSGIETALWDLTAKGAGMPLFRLLGGARTEIPTGISLGIQESIDALLEKIDAALAKGYRRIKVKIKPGWDVDVLRAVRRRFPKINLMADANGAYSLRDLEHLRRLDEFGLMMIEQPLEHDDIIDHAFLQPQLKTPICLDESIRSPDDGRRALMLKSCRIINIKQARVGGTTMAILLHNFCKSENVPVWCGGLLETGIGRAHNIALATLENFTLPGDISASARYYAEDVIDPPVEVTPRGTILVPESPGIGYTVREDRLAAYCVGRRDVL